MLENKYKVWDKKTSKWIEDFLIDKNGVIWFFSENVFPEPQTGTWAVLVRWTGLKDKRGVMIYEGDIINHSYREKHTVISWDDKRAGWSMGGFNSHTVEVIGNIRENPELLNKDPKDIFDLTDNQIDSIGELLNKKNKNIFDLTDEQLNRIGELMGVDIRFSMIWEKMKMRAMINKKDVDYFNKLINKKKDL